MTADPILRPTNDHEHSHVALSSSRSMDNADQRAPLTPEHERLFGALGHEAATNAGFVTISVAIQNGSPVTCTCSTSQPAARTLSIAR